MAILRIARMGHPVLTAPARPVSDPSSPEIRRLAADMAETMADAPGIGLAAPQVHVPLRVVVYHVPPGRAENGQEQPLRVLINPEITVLDETPQTGVEACLSLPGMQGEVPRPSRVRMKALDTEGQTQDYEAEGFHARVICHECDHLDGILYPMRMTDLSTFGYAGEMGRAARREL
ncbi:MAG: peptide deformylase [Rhodospirillales bacterium]